MATANQKDSNGADVLILRDPNTPRTNLSLYLDRSRYCDFTCIGGHTTVNGFVVCSVHGCVRLIAWGSKPLNQSSIFHRYRENFTGNLERNRRDQGSPQQACKPSDRLFCLEHPIQRFFIAEMLGFGGGYDCIDKVRIVGGSSSANQLVFSVTRGSNSFKLVRKLADVMAVHDTLQSQRTGVPRLVLPTSPQGPQQERRKLVQEWFNDLLKQPELAGSPELLRLFPLPSSLSGGVQGVQSTPGSRVNSAPGSRISSQHFSPSSSRAESNHDSSLTGSSVRSLPQPIIQPRGASRSSSNMSTGAPSSSYTHSYSYKYSPQPSSGSFPSSSSSATPSTKHQHTSPVLPAHSSTSSFSSSSSSSSSLSSSSSSSSAAAAAAAAVPVPTPSPSSLRTTTAGVTKVALASQAASTAAAGPFSALTHGLPLPTTDPIATALAAGSPERGATLVAGGAAAGGTAADSSSAFSLYVSSPSASSSPAGGALSSSGALQAAAAAAGATNVHLAPGSPSKGANKDPQHARAALLKQAQRLAALQASPQSKLQSPHAGPLQRERQYSGPMVKVPLKIGLDHFILLKVIGKGSFGKVMLVRKRDSGKIYAMKALEKLNIIKRNQVEHTKTEQRIGTYIRHPFIVTMRYTFQTKKKLFLVMDYYAGGELFFHLGRAGRFSENRTRFYCAQIVVALEYLHSHGIVYRDLKPENVLIGRDGYIVLTDFGLAKEGIEDNHSAKSFCGTPEYLAPEILNRSGHGRAADWWSLGTLFYEMMTGMPPFYSRNRDRLFNKILQANVRIPAFFSAEAKSLLQALLDRDTASRLGSKGDGKEVKQHAFFASIDWGKLCRKELKPPFLPEIKDGELDTGNFDQEFTSMSLCSNTGSSYGSLASSSKDFSGFTYVNPYSLGSSPSFHLGDSSTISPDKPGDPNPFTGATASVLLDSPSLGMLDDFR
eukprot:g50282.t1